MIDMAYELHFGTRKVVEDGMIKTIGRQGMMIQMQLMGMMQMWASCPMMKQMSQTPGTQPGSPK
jgi:hypothetical protein